MKEQFGDVYLQQFGYVTVVEIRRPPYNFFDSELIASLADAFEYLDGVDECRVIVLASEGSAFCAGANFQSNSGAGLFEDDPQRGAGNLYRYAVRLFRARKPVVAAVQGPAVGGGLGLALVADFRVIGEKARFSANFVKLGVHAGFGISHVLPRLVGVQKASLMLLTGRRVGPQEALEIGLADVLATGDEVRAEAIALASEIAEAAPLAVESTRETLRQGLADAVERQVQREFAEQLRLAQTADHAEGIKAVIERRDGQFTRS
ncbi:MAG: enoyl-CoA hydratase/isomerase family protein [Gammaproteobacteria bacterium]|nr:MAG: enoyl-CoA hydratase/isomerase family protein [Gammaproteobacteria bacterium]RLA60856.1 MAG: enoyl-CoA hydratase/isomerase family protein [Gammaproteobacteria bacterium]